MRLHHALKRFHRDERGFSLVFAAFAITGIMLATGISIDLARYYMARGRLQANVTQAALAGAVNFNPAIDSTSQITSAVNAALGANAMPSLMTANTATVSMRCSDELKLNGAKYVSVKNATTSCVNVNKANVVTVKQSATVSLAFGKFLKTASLGIVATSEAVPLAVPPAGFTSPVPYNIAIVVDTTASMNTTDNNCKDSKGNSVSRLDCVKMGLAYFFNALAGSDTSLQLLTFPPLKNTANAGNESCSPSGTPSITANYGSYTPGTKSGEGPYGSKSEIYTVLPQVPAGGPPTATLANNSSFMASAGVLKSSSPFYLALGKFACGNSRSDCSNSCSAGLQAIGGVSTYYGDSLAWARNNLTITNDGKKKDVIIILSDGEANSSSIVSTTDSTNFKPDGKTAIANVVSSLVLNGISGDNATGDRGIKNASFTTPATNYFGAFPASGTCVNGAAYCGKTANSFVVKSGSAFKNECKAAAQYARQLAEFKPLKGAVQLDVPDIYSFYYGSGSNGCTTETDGTYTSCYTMKQIASDSDNFFSVASGCAGNNGAVVDISAAFGQLLYSLLGAAGKPRTVPVGI